jgi:hypothetical protein
LLGQGQQGADVGDKLRVKLIRTDIQRGYIDLCATERRSTFGPQRNWSTNSDHDALQLLSNQFANLAKWASDVVAERQALNGARTVDPNALQNDPALAKISNCGKFLSTMLVSGISVDNSSCD